MSKLAKALSGAAGNAAGDPLYVEDVFSTYLYDGTGAVKTITNGIDLDGEGGVVWIKQRSGTEKHVLAYDENKYLSSNTTDAVTTNVNYVQSFNSNGFQVGVASPVNTNGSTFVSWTFRKAEKFFDVVTYTGNYTAGTTIAHNLGSAPKMMFIKNTSGTGGGNRDWIVYHASLGGTKFLSLNLTASETTRAAEFNNTDPTSSVFTLGGGFNTNQTGESYVAYLFASDAGGFGDDGDENIIKCGGYTADSSNAYPVTLGFEPQFVLIKRTDSSGNWEMIDTMRSFTAEAAGQEFLYSNLNNAEASDSGAYLTSTGFVASNQSASNGASYIYMAIRRPMKTPTAGTEVYNPAAFTGSGSARTVAFNNPIDTAIIDWRSGSNSEGANFVAHRLLGKYFAINDTAAAVTNDYFKLDNSNGVYYPATTYNKTGNNYVNWGLTRAEGFYDVIIGGGNSVTSEVLNHNLGVTPELVLIAGTEIYANKSTSINLTQWVGWGGDYNYGANSGLVSAWNSTQITTQQYISNTTTPQSIMLFATLAGVSKVGSFSGNGSSQTIDCGFTTGARFVMLKRTDAGSNQGVTTSNWYIWDSARGISAGNDPYLTNSLSSNFAENNTTDSIDPHSSGFILNQNATTDVNKSGASYIFLAIA
jgi:hypothetical protein